MIDRYCAHQPGGPRSAVGDSCPRPLRRSSRSSSSATAGVTLTRADVEARIGGSGRDRPETTVVDGIGVISMFGVLAQRMNLFASISGGTSTEQMAAEFRTLVDDREVRAIVFAIDSVGGSVYGIDELATEIRASRGRKPIIAHADSMAGERRVLARRAGR